MAALPEWRSEPRLKPSEVAVIYQAASSGSPTNAKLSSSAGSIVSPFPTTAKVEVGDNDGPVKVNRAEQIAIVFLSAFEMIDETARITLNVPARWTKCSPVRLAQTAFASTI